MRPAANIALPAYGRELRCAVVNDAAPDAMQLFRGRFVGTRPRRGAACQRAQ